MELEMTMSATQPPWSKRVLGTTGLIVDPVCIGAAEIGSMGHIYPDVSDEQAFDTIRAVLDGPCSFLDTSASYGESERRIGDVLRERGGLPEGFVLSTKVHPYPFTSGNGGDDTRRSVERSLRLLNLDQLQLVYLHDPENISFEAATVSGGPVDALRRCKEEGLIAHLGVAGGPIDLMIRYVETDIFEVVLSHNRFTLLNTAADRLWDAAGKRGVAVVNAAPYGGGLLSKGSGAITNYAYRSASNDILARAQRIEEICVRHGVSLAAAALHFSLRDERIISTAVGASRPERVAQTVALVQQPIPDELWSELATVAPDTLDLGRAK
jgi:D-threo-aldose 1-dehydrogenase